MATKSKSPAKTNSKAVAGSGTKAISNSLGGLAAGISNNPFVQMGGHGQQISQIETLFINNRWYMLSNNPQLVSQLYVEHGIIQTLVDQPVDDAFRTGFDIKTGQLNSDEIEQLEYFMENKGALRALKQAKKWARLFGGGDVLVITNQDPITKLSLDKLTPDTPIEFRATNMWELYDPMAATILQGNTEVDGLDFNCEFFTYYGKKVHRSRVFIQKGKEAPSYIRPRLRGWGMSELERVVRSLNQYLKNQDVVFELLDEAKVDVYKMEGFNELLLTAAGTEDVNARIQAANMIKNYVNAITMDTADEYEQKQMAFGGLAEILVQIRQGLAADLKMPMTKLFGISATGFNSGEDDIENYNAMLESEIRSQCQFQIVDLLQIGCAILFGFVPDDLRIVWRPLRILSAKEEEEVKNHQFDRIMKAFESGLIDPKIAQRAINKDALLPIEIDENGKVLPSAEDMAKDLVGNGDTVKP